MKIVKICAKKIKLDEGGSDGYYGMTKQARSWMESKKMAVGDEVTIKTKDGKYGPIIERINKAGSGQSVSSPAVQTSTVNDSTGIVLLKYRDDENIEVKEDGKLQLYAISPVAEKYGRAQVPEGSAISIEIEDDVVVNIKQKKTTSNNNVVGQCSVQMPNEYMRPKTETERAEITASAIGHMVSRTLISMQGLVDPNNVQDLVDELFVKYSIKVTELAANLKANQLKYKNINEEE